MHSAGVNEGDSYINVTRHLYSSILKFFLQKFFFETYFAAVKKRVLKIELHFSMTNFESSVEINTRQLTLSSVSFILFGCSYDRP